MVSVTFPRRVPGGCQRCDAQTDPAARVRRCPLRGRPMAPAGRARGHAHDRSSACSFPTCPGVPMRLGPVGRGGRRPGPSAQVAASAAPGDQSHEPRPHNDGTLLARGRPWWLSVLGHPVQFEFGIITTHRADPRVRSGCPGRLNACMSCRSGCVGGGPASRAVSWTWSAASRRRFGRRGEGRCGATVLPGGPAAVRMGEQVVVATRAPRASGVHVPGGGFVKSRAW